MLGYPKPTKASRVAEKKDKRAELVAYRSDNVSLAIDRDKSLCVFCWFLLGDETPRDDVHHVYGRAKKAGDYREHYTSLVCTCRKHHPPPIRTSGSGLQWVVDVLKMANETPINSEFSHPQE